MVNILTIQIFVISLSFEIKEPVYIGDLIKRFILLSILTVLIKINKLEINIRQTRMKITVMIT